MAKAPKGGHGGAANQRGVEHQNRVAARFLAHLLAEEPFVFPGEASGGRIEWVRCETGEAVDDIHVKIEMPSGDRGFIWAQCKTRADAETSPSNPLADTLAQFVSQFQRAEHPPTQPEEWERALVPGRDALVLVLESGSELISSHLPSILSRLRRTGALGPSDAARNLDERKAIDLLLMHVRRIAPALSDAAIRELLCLIRIVRWDLSDGADEYQATLRLLEERAVAVGGDPAAAWHDLVRVAGMLARERSGVNRDELLRLVRFPTRTPHRFAASISALRKVSRSTLHRLAQHSELPGLPGRAPINVTRSAASELYSTVLEGGAEQGHIAVAGEAGAGKTGILVDVVGRLLDGGRDVVFLSVEDLESPLVNAAELPEVLSNWAGDRPGYLVVDALDAARTDASFGVTKRLLTEICRRCPRWRIVASIRTWDLTYGPVWGDIFRSRRSSPRLCAVRGTCSFAVEGFTREEIGQLQPHFGPLYDLAITASEADRRWMWSPFHLRLAADLLIDGVSADELRSIRQAPDLVARWWAERVRGGTPGACAAAVATLRTIVTTLLAAQTLRLPADRVELADWPTVDRLRSHGVLDKDPTSVAFTHHALFDYAVADLLLGTSSALDFVQAIITRPQFALLARPSIRFHFHRLWGESRSTFWEHVFALENSAVSEVAKVLGPAEAARRFRSVADLEPALQGLQEPSTAATSAAVLEHILGSLDETGTERTTDSRPWAPLARRLAEIPDIRSTYLTSQLLGRLLVEERGAPAGLHDASLGDAARIHLGRVLELGDASLGLLRRAVDATCMLLASDVSGSVSLLRRVIAEAWKEHGHDLIYVFARHIALLIQTDASFAAEVFLAALGYQEERESQVPMGGSLILPFSTSPANTYAGGVHMLREAYPRLLRENVLVATPVIIAALNAFFRRNDRDLESSETFPFRGVRATLQTDFCSIWFKGRAHHDEQVMLQAWEDEVARRHEQGEPVIDILDRTLEMTGLASLWRAILKLGVRDPGGIGLHIREATWSLPLLVGYDTRVTSGELIRVLHPMLSPEEQVKVEEAILSIPAEHPDNAEFSALAVTELLACVPAPRTPAARTAKSAISAVDLNPQPEIEDEPAWIESSPDILAMIRGIDPRLAENSELLALSKELEAFASPYLNDPPGLPAVEAALPLLIRSAETIPAHVGTAEARVVADALGYLAQAAQRCAECRELQTSPTALSVTRDILVGAAQWPGLPRTERDDEQYSGGYGMPDAPVSAAQGLCRLAANAATVTADVLDGVRRLSRHSTAAVRGQVLLRVWWLHKTDAPRMWAILSDCVREEVSPGVLHDAVQSLSILGRKWPEEVAALALQIAELPGDASRGARVRRGEAIELLVHLHVAKGQDRPLGLLLKLASHVGEHPADADAIVRALSEYLTHGDVSSSDPAAEAIRARAWSLMEPICRSSTEAWGAWTAPGAPDAPVDALRGLASVLDQVVLQLHQAIRAGEGGQSNQIVDNAILSRFLREARSSLEALSRINHPRMVHHFIELLADLAPSEPKACLYLMRDSVAGGGRPYAGERLGMDGVTTFLRWLMAEHRDTVTADAEGRIAVLQIVEPFLKAGWPEARRLADEIDRWFR